MTQKSQKLLLSSVAKGASQRRKPNRKPRVKTAKEEAVPGKMIGRLTVLKLTKRGAWLIAKCTCGKRWEGPLGRVLAGNTRSCGCLYREVAGTHFTTHGHKKNGRPTKLYRAWQAMKTRCYGTLPVNRVYVLRGIKVCRRWLKGEGGLSPFECFAKDVGEPPTKLHTIERINNAKGYSPANVRWATRKEQSNNKSDNRILTAFGETRTLPQWAEHLNMSIYALRDRIYRGWDTELALSTPVKQDARFHSR